MGKGKNFHYPQPKGQQAAIRNRIGVSNQKLQFTGDNSPAGVGRGQGDVGGERTGVRRPRADLKARAGQRRGVKYACIFRLSSNFFFFFFLPTFVRHAPLGKMEEKLRVCETLIF